MKKGKVFIAGAGPGDPNLITLKCLKVLKECDVVVYDHLVSKEILSFIPDNVEMIYAGKEAGDHTMSQAEINRTLVGLASEGKKVVRLKGGDPYLFGRGGEEAIYLKKAGIEFEVIPGIPSPVAVPAYAGIPITHRDLTSTLIIVTGNEDPNKVYSSIDWKLLAGMRATIVFLMGVRNLEKICRKLIEEGRPETERCAIIMNGTTPHQKVIRGRLKDIYEKGVEAGLKPPAIFVIGEVAGLSQDLDWFTGLSLHGKRVLLLRPASVSKGIEEDRLKSLLSEDGAEVLHIPSIKLEPTHNRDIDRIVKDIEWSNISVFTSKNGVYFLFDLLLTNRIDARLFGGKTIVSIGDATSSMLRRYGIVADATPPKFTSSELIPLIEKIADNLGEGRVVLLRSKIGNPELAIRLEEKGMVVRDLPIYTAVPAKENAPLLREAIKEGIDCVIFTSPSSISGFLEIVGEEEAIAFLKRTPLFSIGPVTGKALEERKLAYIAHPSDFSVQGIRSSILNYFKTDKGI